MGEQRVALELLHHRLDAVVPTDPEVVTLRHVVGEHDPRSGAQSGQHGEQDVALERLRLVDYHERVVEAAAPDVGQWQHLEDVAIHHLVDHVLADEPLQGVEHRLRPGRHLLRLAARQVAELLTADGVQGPEDDDLAMSTPLEHGFEPSAEGEGGLAGAGAATERDDADRLVEQTVDRDTLLGRAAPQAEGLDVAADQSESAVVGDAGQRRGRVGLHPHPAVHGRLWVETGRAGDER